MATSILGIFIGSLGSALWIQTVTDEVITGCDLEARTKTSTERGVVIVNTGVDDTNLNAFAEDALGVKLGHASGVVRSISRRLFNGDSLGLYRSKLDLLIRPDVQDVREFSQSVERVSLSLDAGAGEHIAGKLLDDRDTVGRSDVLATTTRTGSLEDGECQLGTTTLGGSPRSGHSLEHIQ